MRGDIAWHKLCQCEVEEGSPAGKDDIDEHKDTRSWDVDEYVAWLVVRSVVG